MSDSAFRNAFTPVDYDVWRALVESELRGASFDKLVSPTYEGIEVQPVYSQRDAQNLAALAPKPRDNAPRSGRDLRQEHAQPELAATNQALLEDIAGGVTSLGLRLDRAARAGLDPDDARAGNHVGVGGLMAYCVDDLDVALRGVDLSKTGIALDAGAASVPAVAGLVALWRRRGVKPAHSCFRADPLGALAREGELPYSITDGLARLAELAIWTARRVPGVTAVGVNTSPYHDAGASAVQELAYAMATGVEYLRAMTAAGLTVDEAARQIEFDFSLETQHFLAIAKLRAARLLWRQIIEACDGSATASAMRIHAHMGHRAIAKRDPKTNLLRNAACVFAAGLGGADSITSIPFDAALGLPAEQSRRLARNTALILQEESHLHRVFDPAGGSWFLERYTCEIAEQAWMRFQAIERHGGMARALDSGLIGAEVDATFAERSKNLASGKEGVVGVNEYVDVREEVADDPAFDLTELRRAAEGRIAQQRSAKPVNVSFYGKGDGFESLVDAALRGATIGELSQALHFEQGATRITPFPLRRLAEPFEREWAERLTLS